MMNILHNNHHLPYLEMKSRCTRVPSLKQSHYEREILVDVTHVGSNIEIHTPKKCVVRSGKENTTLLKDHGITTPKVKHSSNLEKN